MAKVSTVESAKETSTSSGNRKAAIWATEFLTTEIARSERRFQASTRPAVFSTALPAIATITRPANACERLSSWIAGFSPLTNQSETNAEAAPLSASNARLDEIDSLGRARSDRCWGGRRAAAAASARRYGTTQNRYTSSRQTAPTIEIALTWWLAGSCDPSERPSSAMMKTVTSMSVAVSLGRRIE